MFLLPKLRRSWGHIIMLKVDIDNVNIENNSIIVMPYLS